MNQEAQIVVFACQKGGSGKTTLSGHIAVEAEKAGAGPVALIDTDPQGSLAKWWNARPSQSPAFAQISVSDLHRDIAQLKKSGFRLIVIDTPPAITNSIAEVISHADLVVLPSRPSPHDLRAVGPTVDLVEYQHKPLIFVINAATARARITGETAVALSQHGTVAPVTVHQRVDFAASMIDGRTVGEVNPTSRSAKEISALWSYLDNRLVRLRGENTLMGDDPLETMESGLLTPMSDPQFEQQTRPAPVPPPEPTAPPVITAAPAEQVVTVTPIAAQTETPPIVENRSALPAANGNWDGIDRRKTDVGPPTGFVERRRSRGFGRRESA